MGRAVRNDVVKVLAAAAVVFGVCVPVAVPVRDPVRAALPSSEEGSGVVGREG